MKYDLSNKFITLEGLDGSGKSTVLPEIVKYLRDRGVIRILTTHEPGGTPVANTLRDLIKYGVSEELIDNYSELLMIYAARFQLLKHVIKPALLKGYWVIGDRYDLSSQAYQGGGRNVDNFLLNILSSKITDILSPDLILYLDVDPEIAFFRIKNRGKLDRIDQEPISFFHKVRSSYKRLVSFKKNVITIDANENVKSVLTSIYKCLDYLLFHC